MNIRVFSLLAAGVLALSMLGGCKPTETPTPDTTPTTTAPTTTTAHTHIYAATKTAATCTEDGSVVYTCPCGDTFSTPLPKLEHVFTNWVVVRKAYYMEDGIRESTCDLCGVEKKTETFPLSEKERREWDEKFEQMVQLRKDLVNEHAKQFMW
jgi:hypothetical protein